MSLFVDIKPTPYHVKSAGVADLHQIADVLASSFYPPLGWQRWLYPVFRFSIYEDLKQRLQVTQKQRYRCLAAVTAGHPEHLREHSRKVVGTVEIACRHRGIWMFNRPYQVYLSNLAVQHKWRRRGIARKLLQASEQQALDWGYQEIYLHVMADNARARQLYQSMGYQLYRVEPTLLSLFIAQPSRLLLRKRLSSSS